jgi:cysteinyl-tRNA synthetase
MPLKIYNTMGRRKEPFDPLVPGEVRMYACGPTVYDRAHIGHARAALTFDVMWRYLEYRGYKVIYVRNYTDVDDKIINRRKAGRKWIRWRADRGVARICGHSDTTPTQAEPLSTFKR